MRFLKFESLDSTNSEASRRAENGDFGPLWISAEVQTKGRGRRGRDWISQTGNLFCTGLYPFENDLRAAAKLSFVAALAVAETLDGFIDPKRVQIKWPNDVLVDGKKIAGILLESGSSDKGIWIAVGMGINLISYPQIAKYKTTHLLAHIEAETFTGVTPMVKTLAARFEYWHVLYSQDGFAPIKKAWLKRACGIGGPVMVNLHDTSFAATALGMDDDGALDVRKENGETVKIHAGDVFFS